MNAFLRRHFLDNPLTGRLLVTALTGPKLGVAFLIVNLTLLCTYVGLFLYFLEEGQVTSDAGSLIFFWQTVVLYGAMCLLLPLKVAGFIEGSRISRVFDQVVVTGASPMRFFGGAWAVGMLFTLVLLVPTVPYVGCAVIFGGVDLGDLLVGYGLLLLYANVMVAVTLALSIFQWEWFAVPAASGLFLLLGLFGLIPEADWVTNFPSHFAELTPMRTLWRLSQPYEVFFRGGVIPLGELITLGPIFFNFEIPHRVYPFAAWGGMVLMSLGVLTVGAGHQFDQGLNTFGAVVFAGDRKRRLTRNLRNAVSRQVELAFFYENRPKWCAGWEFLIRNAIGIVVVLFIWGVILGKTYSGMPIRADRFGNDGVFFGSFILVMLTLGAWILAQCDPRFMIYWSARLGRLRFPRELGQAVLFLLLCALLFAILRWNLASSRPLEDDQASRLYESRWLSLVSGVFLIAVNVFLLSRLMSRATQSATFARVATMLFGVILIVVPMIFIALAENAILGEPFASLGCATPFVLLSETPMPTPWEYDGRLLRFYLIHGALAASTGALLVLFHVSRARLQRIRAAGRTPAPPAAALLLAALPLLSGELRAQDAGEALPRPGVPAAMPAGAEGVLGKRPIPNFSVRDFARGFDGVVFSRDVDYLTFTLENMGDETISGVFRVEIPDFGVDGQALPFEIGPRTTRVIRWDPTIAMPNQRRTSYRVYNVHFESGEHRTSVESVVVQVLQRNEVRRKGKSAPDQSYVFVGAKTHVSPLWINIALAGSREFLADCRSRALPEDPLHYAGATAVFIGPDDMSRWTERQRRALHEYARLGGVVMFYGGLDSSGLSGDATWSRLLKPARSRKISTTAGMLHAIELQEGTALLNIEADGDDGEAGTVPLVSARRIGAGWVGHVAFDLSKPSLPGGLESRNRFWRGFESAMPRAGFPFAVGIRGRGDQHLQDLSSMLVIGLYFLVYSISYGFILIVFFRKRKRRNVLWLTVALVPFVFLIGLPVLNAVLHSKPSRAELRQLTYYTPGSTSGLSVTALRVRSSGRQHHEIDFAGLRPSVRTLDAPRWADFQDQLAYLGRALPLRAVDSPEGSESRFAATVSMAPWAARQFLFTDDAPPATVDGRITIRGDRLEFELETDVIRGGGALQAVLLGPKPRFQVYNLFARAESERRYTGHATLGNVKHSSADAQQLVLNDEVYELAWEPSDDRPRAFIAWIPPTDEPFVSSGDIVFETEVSKRFARRFRTIERDGRFFRPLAHRAVLFELPLETK